MMGSHWAMVPTGMVLNFMAKCTWKQKLNGGKQIIRRWKYHIASTVDFALTRKITSRPNKSLHNNFLGLSRTSSPSTELAKCATGLE